ncbi:FAD/NAD(P)-binding protein [Marinobacterium arenosum]|uniref:FAD/NAD(P)-binding protein n=1 Tax=Marinobacterium arenosum TaxID=2862496 RepID=UPI001C98C375|nr:FAD/NAD(P)-binding protein [Marinobacterium arenosum]MBY4676130.1 FAD/NAD(P)-binding protein [Marinobacterium arenosum]
MQLNPQLPVSAEVIDRVQESPSIFTLRLRLVDPQQQRAYSFQPGQFNMLYLFGVGEVAISIVSDPQDETLIDHTIRVVGRVTEGLAKLQPGQQIGLRGPFGRGWPMAQAQGRDLLIVTGGLGCAPVVAVINYVLLRREQFGRLTIIQGVKHADDLIWRARYDYWSRLPNTEVLIAADQGGPLWPFHHGRVTDLLERLELVPARSIAMLCGPEGMLKAASEGLRRQGLAGDDIYLSMERNMQCALGFCGHCQYGADFICRDGPVFSYRQIADRLGRRGV